MESDQGQVNQLDSYERHNYAAYSPDEQVSSKQSVGAERYVLHTLNATGMRAGMMSALKITADRIAEVGECRCMTSI